MAQEEREQERETRSKNTLRYCIPNLRKLVCNNNARSVNLLRLSFACIISIHNFFKPLASGKDICSFGKDSVDTCQVFAAKLSLYTFSN